FEQKDHREGITAHIKVRDPLLDAVVEDAEVVLLQVEEHLSTGVADGHRRVDLKNARLDLRRRLLLMGLHRRAWLRRDGSGRRLRESRMREEARSEQDQRDGCGSHHADSSGEQARTCALSVFDSTQDSAATLLPPPALSRMKSLAYRGGLMSSD